MVSVEFKNVTKKFGATTAVDGINLALNKGELFFLLGPSGCGKTTCLRMAAGFISPDEGQILFDGSDVSRVPPHGRNVGMVFQTYALFPHMSVEQNIAYGLRFRKIEPAGRKNRVGEIIERTRLQGLGKRMPSQLSGGQQQRVALARALVIQPDVLLLDEPLSNLDTKLRVEVRGEIKRIHSEFGITALYVTHDQDEALSLADRVAVMKDGHIIQTGAPREIYSRPRNEFVARFVGKTNILKARPARRENRPGLDTPAGWIPSEPPAPNAEVSISVRPESVRLVPPEEGAARGNITGVTFLGCTAEVTVALPGGTELTALAVGGFNRRAGEDVGVILEAEDAVVLE